ncbi:MAG: hypothetical protein ABI867_06905 [Kofleriaceae bacterium]
MRAEADTVQIQRLIGRARARIRLQGALEGATTGTILAVALALVSIFTMRAELVGPTTGMLLLGVAGLAIVGGALLGALKYIDDEVIARRIDRASNLSDRLSTAIAFRRTLATAPAASTDDETMELMVAAIRDGARAAPRANIKAATPFTFPKDIKAALGFLVVSALAAGLALPPVDRAPHLFGVDPDHGLPGIKVHLRGSNLLAGVGSPVARLDRAGALIGAPATAATESGFVPSDAYVYLGPADRGRPIQVLDWTRESIRVLIPADAPVGKTKLTVYIGKDKIGPVEFEVVDPKDERFHDPASVLLDPDERAYVESILAQLKELAKREHIEDLDKFIAKIEKLLKDAEEGKITKEQLLAELAKAEEMLNQNQEPNQAEVAKKMGEMGKELQKSEVTKELGKALEKNEPDKAKEELEKLARKLEKSSQEKKLEELEKKLQDPKLSEKEKQEIQKKIDELKKEMTKDLEELKEQLKDKDNKLSEKEKQELQKKIDELKKEKPLTEQQKQELQKQLEQVSKQMDKQDQKDKQQQQEQQKKLEEQIRRLEKDKKEAKTEQERTSAERQLQKKKDELQKLQKDNDQKDQSAQRQALKRLQRDMEKAAEQLQKPNKQESNEEKEEREKQASQKIKDAARETGKVDQDQRKQAQQKKMSSQMDDLREAMRRAKQKGNKGNDPFGKNAKNGDFGKRARGGQGNGGAWKPGQGQPGGQQPGGQGTDPGGQQAGVGHDDNMSGSETGKTGKTKDEELSGTPGGKGPSRRETILAAAQKGFATTSYKKVYQDYQRIVEEVMRTEKLPSSYKYYVKRYFAKIHPSGSPESVTDEPVPAPAPGKNP